MATVKGFVEKIVYRNIENGYTVITLVNEGEEYTLVGTFHYISEGELVEATGTMTEHALYGEQLAVEGYEICVPNDADSVERYLGSGAIKGIGVSLAARIVRKFKADTFRIIEEEPERLAEVKGISERKALEIADQVESKKEMRQAMMFLQDYGISLNLAAKIYNEYGPELYSMIKQNPYRMADDIPGVGFKMADEIASKAGILADSDFRIKSALLYNLLQAAALGHTYLPEAELLKNTSELLHVEIPHIEKHIMDMVIDKRLVVKEVEGVKCIYASKYYYLELNSAKMLHDLSIKADILETQIRNRLSDIQRTADIELDEKQQRAVIASVQNGFLIITGGPGTGKTTTIKGIIKYFETEEMEILLAAPTGRAAKRMTEATGYEAKTIHRLLEVSGVPDAHTPDSQFVRDESNPLDADVIIIDEASMVDIHLIHSLLRAVTVGTRLILVGDINQLPSVGPGNVLRDIIRSGCFPVVMLTKIFRQASESDIIVNAHRINAGKRISLNKKSKDFLFIKREDPNRIINAIITLVKDKLPDYIGASPFEIQIMTPMKKGALGVERLNTILQSFLNPKASSKAEKELAQTVFREGDKVMQIKNNYQIEWEVLSPYGIPVDNGMGIFNGDMGIIKEINNFAELIKVEFDEGRLVEYSFKQAEELELAYAITIHKSQGSEYPAVVIPLLSGPRMLMNRNLIYTAVTRAKSCVCLVGSPEMFQEMVDNESEQRRYSSLDIRLKELKNLTERNFLA